MIRLNPADIALFCVLAAKAVTIATLIHLVVI